MYQHQVYNLFKELDINYWKFYNKAEYKETDNGRLYDYSDVANYIDAQISLREFKRTN